MSSSGNRQRSQKGSLLPDSRATAILQYREPAMTPAAAHEKKSIIGCGAVAFSHGHQESLHVHTEYAQLKWPSTGIAKVRTPRGIFVAGPGHAVWIPAGELHGGVYRGDVLEQNLYVHVLR